jgi:FdrA protein
MDATVCHVIRGSYRDSVWLMRVATEIGARPDVVQSAVMMATAANKAALGELGLLDEVARAAQPDDIIAAVRARSEEAGKAAIEAAIASFERTDDVPEVAFASLRQAVSGTPGANVALVSVPGEFAAIEAREAIKQGLNVMLFSDNVSLEDEMALKSEAKSRGLLVMGPDCGTAIVNGVPLAFANAVQRGVVGLAGASGTGLQEISVLLDRYGFGVSQALGAGGRDTTQSVAGASLLECIEVLDADPVTELLVIISKPPAPGVEETIIARAASARKPVVACFLGGAAGPSANAVSRVGLLEDVIPAVARLSGMPWPATALDYWVSQEETDRMFAEQVSRLRPGQDYVCGLFCGGTLRAEAAIVMGPLLRGGVRLNGDVVSASVLRGELSLQGHLLLDLGADEYTVGRPHPMLDPETRNRLITSVAEESHAAVVLIDVVLGYGAHADPAGAAAEAVVRLRTNAATRGRDVAVVASVCGAAGDPQGLAKSEKVMRAAGAAVLPTNAQAARFAAAVALRSRPEGNRSALVTPANSSGAGKVGPPSSVWGGKTVVINVGLMGFYDELRRSGAQVAHVRWRPPAGGDPRLAARLALIS